MRVFIFLILISVCLAFPTFAQEKKPNVVPKCALENFSLNFDIKLKFPEVKSNNQMIKVTIQTQNSDNYFTFNQDNYKSKLKLYGRFTNVNGANGGWFTDDISTVLEQSVYAGNKPADLNYSKTFLLDPGVYRIDILLFDLNSNRCGLEMKGFKVPKIIVDDTEKNEPSTVKTRVIQLTPFGYITLPKNYWAYMEKDWGDAWGGVIEPLDGSFQISFTAGLVNSAFENYAGKIKWKKELNMENGSIIYALAENASTKSILAEIKGANFTARIENDSDIEKFLEIIKNYRPGRCEKCFSSGTTKYLKKYFERQM